MAKKITEQQQQGLRDARAERNPAGTEPVRPQEKPSTTALTKPLTKLTIKPGQFGEYKNTTVFDHPNDSLLLDVFNRNGLYLETLPIKDYGISGTTLSIDVEKALQSNNYLAGQFTIGLKAIRNYLGSYNGPKLQIQEISNDRLEVRLVPASIDPLSADLSTQDATFQDFFANGFFQLDKLSTLSNLKLNWSLQDSVGVFDYVQDRFTYQAVPFSTIFKLIEPLPSSLSIDDFVWIAQDVSETINEDIIIYPPVPKSSKTYIAGPNFDVNAKKGFQQSTEYKSWNNILTYASSSITTTLLSQSSNEGVELNVDYTRFKNFIHFGSAYARINNFYDKVKVLEYYQDIVDSISTDLSGLAQSSISSSNYYVIQKNSYLSKIESIKGAFDGFEKYMYFQSSSYVSNSFGEFLNMAYPKSTTTKPYTLYPSNNTIVTNWLSGIQQSASLYDNSNSHRLVNFIPSHVQEDPGNEITSTFIDMIGHFFDTQYQYVHQFTNIHDRHQSLTEGFAKDLVHYVAESLGTDFDNGNSFDDLWSYTLGYNTSGSYNNGLNLSSEDRTREIWKRIINNLPYLLKTRGTERGLRALINMFGLPSTILRIREFGGPEPDFDTQSTYDHDRFYYALRIGSGSSRVQVNWRDISSGVAATAKVPQSFEFRFKAENSYASNGAGSVRLAHLIKSSPFQSILHVNAGHDAVGDFVELYLSGSTSSSRAYISSSADNTKLFDGNWVNVLVDRSGYTNLSTQATSSYQLFIGQKANYSETPIIASASIMYQSSNIGDSRGWLVDSTALEFGTGSAFNGVETSSFSGSLQDLRLWGNANISQSTVVANPPTPTLLCVTGGLNLEQSPFYAHIISPTTIVGANYEDQSWTGATSSFADLVFRLPLGTDNKKINLSTTSSLSGSQPNYNYTTRSGSFINYNTNTSSYWSPIIETNYMPWPDLGGNRQISNKIRVDQLYTPSTELFWNRMTEKSLQDSQPTDSPRLGVYFSTTDQVNEDIAEQFGGLHLDDYIGGYGSLYSSSYDDLEQVQRAYFKKYGWNSSSSFGTSSPKFDSATYIRLISNFDGALFNLVKKFVPHRANLQTGLVIEPHVLHRPKIGYKKPTWSDETYETTIDVPDQTQTPGGAVQDAAGGGQADYCWDGEIARPYVTPIGEYPEQTNVNLSTEVTVTLVGAQNEYNNREINEQLVQADSLYGTADADYTSYGREKILGSQYDFYTWYRTGSGDTDWVYDRANSRDQWDPIGISILNSRKSETMTVSDARASYNGTDIYKGSGSLLRTTTFNFTTDFVSESIADTTGSVAKLGIRVQTESASLVEHYNASHYWFLSANDFLSYQPAAGNRATGSVKFNAFSTYQSNGNALPDYYTVSLTLQVTANGTATASLWFGDSGSSATPDVTANLLSTATSSIKNRVVIGPTNPDLFIQFRASASAANPVAAYIDGIVVRPYTYAQVQDYQCGDNASYGQRNQKYYGSKLVSNDWNQDSLDTIDGGPVISIIEGPGVEIAVDPNANGTFNFR